LIEQVEDLLNETRNKAFAQETNFTSEPTQETNFPPNRKIDSCKLGNKLPVEEEQRKRINESDDGIPENFTKLLSIFDGIEYLNISKRLLGATAIQENGILYVIPKTGEDATWLEQRAMPYFRKQLPEVEIEIRRF
jgi:hypothetical protein